MRGRSTSASRAVLALTLLGAGLATPPARGDRLAVADFRFLNAPPALHGPVEEILTQALRASGWELVAPAGKDPQKALDATSGCVAGPCLARQARALRADHVLPGAVAAHGSSSYDVTLSVLDPEGGAVIAQVTRRCDVCNYGDVTASVARAATTLRAAAQKALKVQGWLEVHTEPAEAAVYVDGALAGRAPLRRLLGAGPHRLAAYKAGLGSQRTVRVRAGATARHTLQLDASAAELPQRSAVWRWVGWSIVGVGAAAAGSGAGIWSQAGTCEGSCRETRSALGGGLVGGGVAAMGAGALLLILDSLGCRDAAQSLAVDASPGALRIAFTFRR